jgi:hypothetical protein
MFNDEGKEKKSPIPPPPSLKNLEKSVVMDIGDLVQVDTDEEDIASHLAMLRYNPSMVIYFTSLAPKDRIKMALFLALVERYNLSFLYKVWLYYAILEGNSSKEREGSKDLVEIINALGGASGGSSGGRGHPFPLE